MSFIAGFNEPVPVVSVQAPVGNVGEDWASNLRGFDFASNTAYTDEAVIIPDQAADYSTVTVRLLVPDSAHNNYDTPDPTTPNPPSDTPNTPNAYIIYGKSPGYASRIFINGELAAEIGHIDEENPENNTYQEAQFRIPTRPKNGEIEVVFHMAGIIRDDPAYHGLYIGEYGLANAALLRDTVYGLIPVFIFLTCALFYIGYFLFVPSVRTNLWFAFISLIIGVFISYNWRIGFNLFPALEYRTEYLGFHISLLLICVCHSFFARSLFGVPRAVPIAACIGSLLMAVWLVATPVKITAQYSFLYTAFVFAVMAANVVCIIARMRHFRIEQAISFCGQVAFMLCGVFDMLGLESGSLWDFSIFGMLIFLFAQMASLYLVNNRAVESERRLAAEKASLESLNSMKTELLGNISHEFKTPLTVISNVSQLAARHTSDVYIRDKMGIAVTEVERMKNKVGQLLKLTRMEDEGLRPEFRPVDVREFIQGMAQTYFQALDENNNTLKIELPESLPAVNADPTHLTGVIVNLIENAIRFTKNGRITIKARSDGGFVAVSVEDTGCGMTEEQRERIFERYFTGERSTGTGLGLYICKKTIDTHGGEIFVESEPGRGTAVSFTLPVNKGADGAEAEDGETEGGA
ncbi:MAG: sensor histidine kinase [Clostridiales bacterium]|nr:sensor histidine kinase [Clostridiales bacterium]